MSIVRDLEHFPAKKHLNFLGYCSVSPLSKPAAERATHALDRQMAIGRGMIFEYQGDEHVGDRFHKNFGELLKTSPDNISMTTNTSGPLCMVANGYPFEPGDEIISYVNEYPANHYPWVVQTRRRGVKVVLLDDVDAVQESRDGVEAIPDAFARAWSFEQLETLVTDRTRMIAISAVQFTSGFAADLPRLGEFCKSKDIDLVVDAAQGLGCMPIYPEEMGIACIASAGWKWLLGPIGSGMLYTSPNFRAKIEITMTGADQMVQDTEYLDHTWSPHLTGRKFEYSTVPYGLLDGLSVGLEMVFLPNSIEAIYAHNIALQELTLEQLDFAKYQPVIHVAKNRSGILSLIPKFSNAKSISDSLERQGIVITPRDGYLRFAPHLCTTEDEIVQAVGALNALV